MRLLPRRVAPPADALARLEPEEPVVSWADTPDGPVIVTPLGVWWPFADGPRRVTYDRIDRAVWRDGQLILTEADLQDELILIDRRPVAVELQAPRNVPDALRKRINQSVVRTEVLPVSGGAARFVARRVPGVDGVQWQARLEPGTRDTPAVRESVAIIAGQLRARWLAERADN